jgi:DNA (cytosine-5)-methyltransferase 1
MPKSSYITVTDQFCGAGGSSLGAVAAGAELKMALNHWKLAIETHNSNFPQADHDCTDISACDPRRYPRTDILITSPECTNHSLAKGKKRSPYKQDLFDNLLIDPAEERSRATMWDVCRFAEEHDYSIIIVENVVDARRWVMWPAWLQAMKLLKYDHKCVYFNSMFAHPTPQSRDRMYVVFWKEGNRAPDLNFCPRSWCNHCGKDVDALQNWKSTSLVEQFGRYGSRGQYVYICPNCSFTVHPYYYPALTAIDWSLPIQRIGDRARPLKEKTLARIQLGLERFGEQYLVMQTKYSHAGNNRASSVESPWPTQTAQQEYALVSAQIVKLRNNETTAPATDPLNTVSAGGIHAGLLMPFLTRHYTSDGNLSNPVTDPTGTVTATDHHSLTVPVPWMLRMTGEFGMEGIDKPLFTQVAAGSQQFIVAPAPFLASYYGTDTLTSVASAMGTATGVDRHSLVMPAPFIASQYGGPHRNAVRRVDGEMPTVPGMAVHHLVQPGQVSSIDDCGFRMLEPQEIGRAMAFPSDYVVLGNKRERVKQYGNAVTPPVMEMIFKRCVESLS